MVVGDIVRVKNNEDFPCDMILFSSSLPTGECYITTANLDGESTLKVRSALKDTVQLSPAQLAQTFCWVDCSPPTPDLYSFNGRLKIVEPRLPSVFPAGIDSADDEEQDGDGAQGKDASHLLPPPSPTQPPSPTREPNGRAGSGSPGPSPKAAIGDRFVSFLRSASSAMHFTQSGWLGGRGEGGCGEEKQLTPPHIATDDLEFARANSLRSRARSESLSRYHGLVQRGGVGRNQAIGSHPSSLFSLHRSGDAMGLAAFRSLDKRQLLLKGARLRNTDFVLGLVVYTGEYVIEEGGVCNSHLSISHDRHPTATAKSSSTSARSVLL